MSRNLLLFLLLSLAVASSLAGLGVMWDYWKTAESPLNNPQTVLFDVGKGQGLSAITEALAKQGLTDRPLWFRLMAWREQAAKRLKYGEYEIPPHTTHRQLLDMFLSGKVKNYSVTLVEGWTFKQVLGALRSQPALAHQLDSKSADEIMNLLGFPGQWPEGRFFPDTYWFTRGTPDVELLQHAYHKMQAVLENEWQNRAEGLALRDAYEALILASIIEKETAVADERVLVSGVFHRRLAKKMLLQTDPTVIYGMGDAYTGNIHKEDLRRDTPYNTYVRPGLPPTPIAMPGLASIHAALHPDSGSSLYFVASGNGRHVFSATLSEHQKAVNQYQLK